MKPGTEFARHHIVSVRGQRGTGASPPPADPQAPTVNDRQQRRGAPRGRRPGSLLAGAALLIVALAIGGFALGRAGRENGSTAGMLGGSASNGDVQLSFPSAWSRSAAAPALPGLRLERAIAVGPDGGPQAGLVVGRVGRTGTGLLPEELLAQLGGKAPDAERVHVGDLQALLYPGVSPGGGERTYDLAMVPTSQGTLAFACHAPPGQLDDVRLSCARVARSAQLVRGEPVAIDPSPKYAGVLSAIITRLRRERSTGRRRLTAARSADSQALSAAALSAAYAAAARGVREAPTPPRAARLGNELVEALSAASYAYRDLARAARAGDQRAFASNARAVDGAEGAVQRALRALAGAGYKVS